MLGHTSVANGGLLMLMPPSSPRPVRPTHEISPGFPISMTPRCSDAHRAGRYILRTASCFSEEVDGEYAAADMSSCLFAVGR